MNVYKNINFNNIFELYTVRTETEIKSFPETKKTLSNISFEINPHLKEF